MIPLEEFIYNYLLTLSKSIIPKKGGMNKKNLIIKLFKSLRGENKEKYNKI
jgi:hypothetical protein